MKPLKLINNSSSIQDVWYITKNDHRDENGNISIYKLIIRPLFFIFTNGEIAHEIIIGKIYGKFYRWLWCKNKN